MWYPDHQVVMEVGEHVHDIGLELVDSASDRSVEASEVDLQFVDRLRVQHCDPAQHTIGPGQAGLTQPIVGHVADDYAVPRAVWRHGANVVEVSMLAPVDDEQGSH
jgi:hypothetical protein